MTLSSKPHGDAIAKAFALAHDDLPAPEIDVLHAQPKTFEHAHARAVEQPENKAGRALRFRQDTPSLISREHNGQLRRTLRRGYIVEPRQLHPKHFLVDEQNGTSRLILSRCGDVALDCEMREKRLDIAGPAVPRMAQAAEAHIAAHPLDICLLRANAVVLEPNRVPQLIEEPARTGRVRLMRLLYADKVVTIHRKHRAEWGDEWGDS
jgi:hypothetical protein